MLSDKTISFSNLNTVVYLDVVMWLIQCIISFCVPIYGTIWSSVPSLRIHTHSKVYCHAYCIRMCPSQKQVLPLDSSMVNTTRHILNIYRIQEKRWRAVHKGWPKKKIMLKLICLDSRYLIFYDIKFSHFWKRSLLYCKVKKIWK